MENIPYIEVNATWKKACQHFRGSFRGVEACLATRPTCKVQRRAKPFWVSLICLVHLYLLKLFLTAKISKLITMKYNIGDRVITVGIVIIMVGPHRFFN